MIRYDTQAAYPGIKSQGDLIVATYRISRIIDARTAGPPDNLQRYKSCAGTSETSRAEGQPIYDKY